MSFFVQFFFGKCLDEPAIIFHTICNLFVTSLSHSHFFYSASLYHGHTLICMKYNSATIKSMLHFFCLFDYIFCLCSDFVCVYCVCFFPQWSEGICHKIQSFRIINTRIIRMFWPYTKWPQTGPACPSNATNRDEYTR